MKLLNEAIDSRLIPEKKNILNILIVKSLIADNLIL